MILLRLLILAFNVAIITFLIFEMIRVSRLPMDKTRKRLIIAGGVLLLLSPLAMFIRIIPATTQYFLIYPVALALYIYLIRNL